MIAEVAKTLSKYLEGTGSIQVEVISGEETSSTENEETSTTNVVVETPSKVLETLYEGTQYLCENLDKVYDKHLPVEKEIKFKGFSRVFHSLWEAQKEDDAQASANDQIEVDYHSTSNGDRANDQTMVDFSYSSNDDAPKRKRKREHQMDRGFSKTRKMMHQTGANSFSDSDSGSFA